MIYVQRKKNESIDAMIKRFNALVAQDGILKDLKERSFYEKPSEKKRRKKIERMKEQRKNM